MADYLISKIFCIFLFKTKSVIFPVFIPVFKLHYHIYLAVIVEAAAVNHRQKKMGYNAAKELYRRVQENLMRGDDDDE